MAECSTSLFSCYYFVFKFQMLEKDSHYLISIVTTVIKIYYILKIMKGFSKEQFPGGRCLQIFLDYIIHILRLLERSGSYKMMLVRVEQTPGLLGETLVQGLRKEREAQAPKLVSPKAIRIQGHCISTCQNRDQCSMHCQVFPYSQNVCVLLTFMC